MFGLVGALALACASGSPSDSATSLFAPSDDEDFEPAELVEVRAELGLVDDEELTERVARIGARVARSSAVRSFTPSFHVVDQDVANVFTVAGHYVFVTRGLLTSVASESELANLLAHELAHGEAGDLTAGAAGIPALGFGSAVLQAAVGRRAPARFAAGATLVGRFAASTEPAADALGQRNSAAAGFDPAAFVSALRALVSLRREGEASMPGFFLRHPSARDRSASAKARAGELARAPATARDDEPMAWLEGLRVGPNPGDGIFVGNRFVHLDHGYSLRLPRGWERLQSRRAVGATAPAGNAQLVFERQGPVAPPEAAGSQFLEELESRMELRVERRETLRTGGVPGYRAIAFAETPSGPVRLELHWFALASGVFRMVGASPPANAEKAEVAMRNVARSLQPLGDRERTTIEEEQLRFEATEPGESVRALSRRVGNAWSPERTAAINRVDVDEKLAAGTRVRVAVRVPYRDRNFGARAVRRTAP